MLDRAIRKLERRKLARRKLARLGGETRPPLADLVRQVTAALAGQSTPAYPERLSSRVGDKVDVIELSRVTHLYAEDKLTFAATPGKNYILDLTIAERSQARSPAVCADSPRNARECGICAGTLYLFRRKNVDAAER